MPPNSVVIRCVTTFILFISVHLSTYAQVNTTGIAKLDSGISTVLLVLKLFIAAAILLLSTKIYKEMRFRTRVQQIQHMFIIDVVLIIF